MFLLSRFLPDAVVLDLDMPETDGLALLKRIRRSSYGCHLPVLLVTGTGNQETLEEGFESGLDDYIRKPVSPRELLLRLAAILRRTAPKGPGIHPEEWSGGELGSGILLWRRGRGTLESDLAGRLARTMDSICEHWCHRFRDRLMERHAGLSVAQLPVLILSSECWFLPMPGDFPHILWMDWLQQEAHILERIWRIASLRSATEPILIRHSHGYVGQGKKPALRLRWISNVSSLQPFQLVEALEIVLGMEPEDVMLRKIEL